MDCEQARTLISAEIDGELDQDRALLDAHLAECADCRQTASAIRQQDANLRRAFAARRQAADAVADRVIAQLHSTRPSVAMDKAGSEARPVTYRLPWTAMLLSAAAGFLIAVLVFRPWRNAVTPVELTGRQPTYPKNELRQPDGEETTIVETPSQRQLRPEAIPDSDQPIDRTLPTAELVVAMGVIEMLPPGRDNWEPMNTGGTIAPGTRVRTGPEGRCEFHTPDGSDVRLNVNTELLFQSNRKLELAEGQVWSSVAKDPEPYQVRLPSAEATVTALGTQFDIESKPEETLLTVVQGVTQVEGRDGKQVTHVHAREMARIVGGAVEQKQRVANLVVATSWVHEILKLKGHDNPELAERMDDLFAQIGEGKMKYMGEKEIIDLGDHCVLPLTRFIQSERSRGNRPQRVEAARILGKIAQPWSISDLIELLSDDDAGVRYHAAAALERLTSGETHGLNPSDWTKAAEDHRNAAIQKWQQWWEKNKEEYPKSPFAPEDAGPIKRPRKA